MSDPNEARRRFGIDREAQTRHVFSEKETEILQELGLQIHTFLGTTPRQLIDENEDFILGGENAGVVGISLTEFNHVLDERTIAGMQAAYSPSDENTSFIFHETRTKPYKEQLKILKDYQNSLMMSPELKGIRVSPPTAPEGIELAFIDPNLLAHATPSSTRTRTVDPINNQRIFIAGRLTSDNRANNVVIRLGFPDESCAIGVGLAPLVYPSYII